MVIADSSEDFTELVAIPLIERTERGIKHNLYIKSLLSKTGIRNALISFDDLKGILLKYRGAFFSLRMFVVASRDNRTFFRCLLRT